MSASPRVLEPRAFSRAIRDMAPQSLALAPFGVVCGVAAHALGLSFASMLALSAIVFSGAAQILALQLYEAGAPVAVVVLACFVVGLRLVMYSAALAPYFSRLPPRWRHALAFVVTDQSFAQTVRLFGADAPRGTTASYFLGCGVALWVGWQLSNAAGYLAGNVIPASWSLDFAVPLCFLALLAPLLRERTMQVACLAAAVAVVLLAGLPMRLNVVVAGLIGIAAGTVAESLRARGSR